MKKNLKVYVFEPKESVEYVRESYYFLAENKRDAWRMFFEDCKANTSEEKQDYRNSFIIFCHNKPGKFEEIVD